MHAQHMHTAPEIQELIAPEECLWQRKTDDIKKQAQ